MLVFKDIFRHATLPSIIDADSCERWLQYRDNRNSTAHEGSDLDLVISTPNREPISLEIYSDLVEKIKQSNMPFLVELRD